MMRCKVCLDAEVAIAERRHISAFTRRAGNSALAAGSPLIPTAALLAL